MSEKYYSAATKCTSMFYRCTDERGCWHVKKTLLPALPENTTGIFRRKSVRQTFEPLAGLRVQGEAKISLTPTNVSCEIAVKLP